MAQFIHGHSPGRNKGMTPEYAAWLAMRQRCTNPRNPRFKHYGARGITVCERWDSFENFLADMGPRPEKKVLDRWPNNDGNYEPSNVRWATISESNYNRRHPKHLPPSKKRKLTQEQALAIRADTRSQRTIAIDYSIDQQTVWAIKHSKTYV